MNPIAIKVGGYQGPTSINTRAAARFGDVLRERLGEEVSFELVGDVLALGRNSGDLPDMVAKAASSRSATCLQSASRRRSRS